MAVNIEDVFVLLLLLLLSSLLAQRVPTAFDGCNKCPFATMLVLAVADMFMLTWLQFEELREPLRCYVFAKADLLLRFRTTLV